MFGQHVHFEQMRRCIHLTAQREAHRLPIAFGNAQDSRSDAIEQVPRRQAVHREQVVGTVAEQQRGGAAFDVEQRLDVGFESRPDDDARHQLFLLGPQPAF
jgi:hypothetical protein